MPQRFLLILLLPLHFAWSVQIIQSKGANNRWYLAFSHIPAIEKIGAFKVNIHITDNFEITGISTDAPAQGAWSQIKPELSNKGNIIQIIGLGPAMLNSQIVDTLEMFHMSLDISGKNQTSSNNSEMIDSIWFSECLDTRGNKITPQIISKTASFKDFKKATDHIEKIQFRSTGRIHSLSFNLAGKEMVKAWVIDISGKLVTKLVEKQLKPGLHTLRWPENGRQVATGTYFIQLEINHFTYHKKVSYCR